MLTWSAAGRPGHLGRRRGEYESTWTEKYGQHGWRLAWIVGGTYFPQQAALALYEDAYHHLLATDRSLREELTARYADVVAEEEADVATALDYSLQSRVAHHLEDIAVRRALVRLGTWFAGEGFLRLGGVDRMERPSELQMALSPHRLLFHRPDLIVRPELPGWWDEGSVESFYQSNKFLQVLR